MHSELTHPELTPAIRTQLMKLGISARQADVLFWIASGKTNEEIGIILGIRTSTIDTHVKKLFSRLGVNNRVSAAARAFIAMTT